MKTSFLREVAEIIDSLHQTPKYSISGYPMVRVVDVKYGILNLSETKKVNETVYSEFSRRYKPEVDDIIITRVGSYGISALVKDTEFCLGQNTAALKPKINKRYLYYVLNSPTLKKEIEYSTVGSTQKTLSLKAIGNLQIPRFDERTEQLIGETLFLIDNKIQNNLSINETLQEMAMSIFKSWFVDFDPVHAKAAGNSPAHMDHKTAALFPSSFGDDGLPVGWQHKKLQDTSDLSWGDLKTTKKSYVETGFDAYSASGKDGKLPHFDFEKLGIVLSAIGANCGYTWLARGKWSCIKNTIRFWSKYDLTPTIFLYHATKGNNFWPIRGSAQPFISQGDARDQKIIVPANGEAISFEKIVGDFYEKISANEHENQTLAKLRNTLLPKLMSGEIHVKDAELKVEAAV